MKTIKIQLTVVKARKNNEIYSMAANQMEQKYWLFFSDNAIVLDSLKLQYFKNNFVKITNLLDQMNQLMND